MTAAGLPVEKDARMAVMVVPMLAPMIIGIASPRGRVPAATSPTMIDVVVDELWIRLVVRKPMMSPARGSEAVPIRRSVKSFQNILKAELIRSMLTKNR